MRIVKDEVQKSFRFDGIEEGDIFTLENENTLFMKTRELRMYEPCGDYQAYNAVNLKTFEIGEISEYANVVVFTKSFLTVE